jgi:coenzyme F420-reducing hydrogenase alpha subunit
LRRFRTLAEGGGPVLGSFHYHQARLIEILYALEKIGALLTDPELTDELSMCAVTPAPTTRLGSVWSRRRAAACSMSTMSTTTAC